MAQTNGQNDSGIWATNSATTSYVTDLWLRKCSVWLAKRPTSGATASSTGETTQGANGSTAGLVDALVFTDEFRIRFQTRQSDPGNGVPNTAWIRIYNLNPKTIKGLLKEYASVVLQAGYKTGKFGVIFQGTIKQYRYGHENPTDSYLDIYAADGDEAHNYARTSVTLPKGWTNDDLLREHVKAMKDYGITEGHGVKVRPGQLPGGVFTANLRGTTQYVMTRDGLTDATGIAGSTWIIDKGKLQIVPLKGYLPGEAVVLTGHTGLVGFPEQTESGINARALLNPAIKCQGLVQINNKSINQTTVVGDTFGAFGGEDVGEAAGTNVSHFPSRVDMRMFASIAEDGFYRVLVVEHAGDTRGNDWYTNLVLLEADLSAEQQLATAKGDALFDIFQTKGMGVVSTLPDDVPSGSTTSEDIPIPAYLT
jgi:hypothetical protein